jgi:hypothetical protein
MITDIDMNEREGPCGSPQMFPDPRLRLRSKDFIAKLLPEFFQDRKRQPPASVAEETSRILSFYLANVAKAGERRVIVSLDKNKKIGDFSPKLLVKTVHRMDSLGWIDLRRGD